ncbi:glycosyltransferase family 39 protein [Candidatus Poribacteria bacterium]|nr:glycosyltransferase family 39 protein [Candidatus Poribacteria bacterium]
MNLFRSEEHVGNWGQFNPQSAASIMAFSSFMMRLTQGYLFSDAIDISLLFWTELGIYFLIRVVKTGRWRFVLFAGIAQGAAFLSKSYPAFIITGLSLSAWLAPSLGMGRREECRLRGRHIWGLLAATLLVASPWTLFTAIQYPIEFQIEHDYIWEHLVQGVEGWGAPWHKVLLEYSFHIFHAFYLPVILAVFWTIRRLFTEKSIGFCMLYVWGFGVLTPFLFAATKTPSATLIGMPAFLLILGDFAVRTLHRKPSETRRRSVLRMIWAILLILSFLTEAVDAWWIARQNRNDRTFSEIAAFAETHLPKNAVLLTEIDKKKKKNNDDHLRLMFLTERTAHPYSSPDAWEALAKRISANSGIPYVVSFRKLDLPVLFNSEVDGRTVYSLEHRP